MSGEQHITDYPTLTEYESKDGLYNYRSPGGEAKR